MQVARLVKRNQYEHITEQLKKLIVSGALKPGDKLPSAKALADRFGVGRSTIREALSALKAMGLIDVRQGGASTVLPPPPAGAGTVLALHPAVGENLRLNRQAILDLLEARQSFEIANAGIAARKRTDEDLAAFRRILADMEAALGVKPDPAAGEPETAGERTDLAFHRQLAAATHNSVLISLFEAVSSRMELAIRETRRAALSTDRSEAVRLLEEHAAIFDAVARGDAAAAEARMRDHLRHVERMLMKHLR